MSFYAEEHRKIINEAFYNALEYGRPYDLELQMNPAGGGSKWVRTNGRSLVEDGKVVRLVGTLLDISARKEAEEESKEHHLRLRGIIDSWYSAIYSVDRQYCYTGFNSAHFAGARARYGAEIKIGDSSLDYRSGTENREAAKLRLDRALAGEQFVVTLHFDDEAPDPDYFEVSFNPIKSSDGSVVGAAVFVHDITESKRAEKTIRESEARLRKAQAVGHVGNWDWNLQTNDTFWSEEAYRIFRLSPEVAPRSRLSCLPWIRSMWRL